MLQITLLILLSQDGVFNYASAVLNEGLLLLELRDAIHEGDGPRIIPCWKFMLLHWRHAGHSKYAHEVVHLFVQYRQLPHRDLLMNLCGAKPLTTFQLTCT